MWNPFLYGPRLDRAGESAPSGAVDTNIPISVDDLIPPEPAKGGKAPEKSEVEKRLEALESENKRLSTRISESENDARYWQQRARGGANEDRQPEPEEPEPAAEPDPVEEIPPEQFLEVLSKEGIKGLRRFGFMTQREVDAKVAEVARDGDRKLAAAAQSVAIDNRLAREFPELLEDNQRVHRGEKPQTELFNRTSTIFRELVADDPTLKNSPGAMLMAARQAKGQLDAEKKAKEGQQDGNGNRQRDRRERIDTQRGERDRPEEFEGGRPELPSQARDVIAALSHHGVKEEDYTRGR